MYENKRLVYLGNRLELDGLLQHQIAEFLPTERVANVLDYGAGNSPYRHLLAYDSYVTADVTQNQSGTIDHLITPGESLQIPNETFDLVLLLDVLEHVANPDFVLGEIRRLLKRRGRLIVSVPFMYREHETPHDFARYTLFGIQELVRRQSGHILRVRKAGNIYYTLLSLFVERAIANGEQSRLGWFGRLLNKGIRLLVPITAPWLRKAPDDDAGIYHHLLVEVEF